MLGCLWVALPCVGSDGKSPRKPTPWEGTVALRKGLGGQTELRSSPRFSACSCVTLGRFLTLQGPQSPHL